MIVIELDHNTADILITYSVQLSLPSSLPNAWSPTMEMVQLRSTVSLQDWSLFSRSLALILNFVSALSAD
jgi:hypothetical protein